MLESGTLVMARNAAEAAVLERLRRMGLECGVEGLEMLTRDEFLKKEPLATPAVSALFSPTGASVDAHALVEALTQDARSLGVEFRFVEKFERIEGGEVVTTSGRFRAEHLVNCAGLYADRVAHAMGVRRDLCIIPFRGEYMEVRDCAVSGMIYQPPDLRFPFLSVHLTREADGRVLAGPTAVLSLGREAYDKQICWPEALGMFVSPQFAGLAVNPAFLRLAWQNAKTCLSRRAFLEQIRSIVPSIRADQIIPFRAGIRAQMVDRTGRLVDDMVVEYGKDSTHVLNVVSPGMTCSLAFAEHIVDGIEARV